MRRRRGHRRWPESAPTTAGSCACSTTWRRTARPNCALRYAPRKTEGGGANAPGDGLGAALRVYTAADSGTLAPARRSGPRNRQAHDVKLVRDRYGAGLEGRWPDVTLELVAWSNTGMLSRTGASANVLWQPDDHWTFDLDLQAFSSATPLRAVEAGVHANSADVSAIYAWDESRVASASITALDFSDGNRRLQGQADFAAAIIDAPHLDIVLRPALYASRNTLRDAPYFNPRRDASLTLALELTHILWREYERSLTQRLVANAGGYWQSDFGQGAIAEVSYTQTFRVEPRTEWNYGLQWSRRLYDGDTEHSLTAFVQLNQRF